MISRLNVILVSLLYAQKCTITPSGYCASISHYNPRQDFRVNASTSAAHYFPSSNTTYCESGDAVCTYCRATSFQVSRSGGVNPPQYCVGEGGCVCVGFCESPMWRSTVADSLCQYPATPVNNIESSLSLAGPLRMVALITMTVITVVAALAVLLSCRGMLATTPKCIQCYESSTDEPVCCLTARSWRQQAQERALLRAQQRRSEAAHGPALELPAWKALREELIESEHLAPEHKERRISAPTSHRNSEAMLAV